MVETPVTPKTLLVIADGYYSNGCIINSAWDLRGDSIPVSVWYKSLHAHHTTRQEL